MTHFLKMLVFGVLFQIVTLAPQVSAESGSYDIDCKIILCLPAGFPGECRDAYTTFIKRITRIPPKPPIGFCAMGSVRDVEMHDTHPDRFDVMFDVIDEERMERTLRSVKVEYHRRRMTCCWGKECDNEYPCTSTYFINGDGSRFRHANINGHHTGSKILYTDLEGKSCVSGNARSWVPPLRKCRQVSKDDQYCWTARPGYWRDHATCSSGP